MIDKTKALENKILLGYAFRKLTMKTVDECFFHCYEDCFCMAFQMCQSAECQLLSTNQFQSSSALVTMKGCSYYDMLPDFEQVKKFTAVDGFLYLEFSNLISLLDLTRSTGENYSCKPWNRTCGTAIPVQRSNHKS
jgi:hypothetical protein